MVSGCSFLSLHRVEQFLLLVLGIFLIVWALFCFAFVLGVRKFLQ